MWTMSNITRRVSSLRWLVMCDEILDNTLLGIARCSSREELRNNKYVDKMQIHPTFGNKSKSFLNQEIWQTSIPE